MTAIAVALAIGFLVGVPVGIAFLALGLAWGARDARERGTFVLAGFDHAGVTPTAVVGSFARVSGAVLGSLAHRRPGSGAFCRVIVATEADGAADGAADVVVTIDDGSVDPVAHPGHADTFTIPASTLTWDALVELFFRLADGELTIRRDPDDDGTRFQIVGRVGVATWGGARPEPGSAMGTALFFPWRPWA